MSSVTEVLQAVRSGDPGASDRLIPIVYEELRRLAGQAMAGEGTGQTLQPTALVHEAWLRLGADAQPCWQNRAHFFGAAAEAMRRILIDNARRKARQRHGGGKPRLRLEELDELDVAVHTSNECLMDVDDALHLLEAEEPDVARIVKLRFFAGLSVREIAKMDGVSERTVKRTWAYARAWLIDQLASPPAHGDDRSVG